MQSETEIKALSVQWAQTHAPNGFVANAANGGLIKAYLDAKGLEVTLENLTWAVQQLATNLEWQPGFGPAATPTAKPDTRSASAKLYDCGVQAHTGRQSQADKDEEAAKQAARATSWKEHGPEAQRRMRDEQQAQWQAENITIYRDSGRVDHVATAKARADAINKYATINAAKANAATGSKGKS
jgi:hypothetical protein